MDIQADKPTEPNVMRKQLAAFGVLFLITLALFGDVLLSGGTQILGNQNTDLYHQLIGWRQFGFEQLRSGHIALWNPHIYAGAPYVGGFQSALFYPLNWIFLVLPLATAINWSIALHVFMMGAFFLWWAKRGGASVVASGLGATAVMLSGPFFLHIYAGHLPNLCAMVWVPLVFLSVDEIFIACRSASVDQHKALRWALFGAMATALQILAGHPQYVFYTAVAVVLYAALKLCIRPGQLRVVGYLVLVPLGALLLSAVQLLPSLQTASEIVRSKSLSYEFASMFSFPPENLLTMFAPYILGALEPMQYFGRGYLWEMSSFVGVVTLVMVGFGVANVRAAALPDGAPNSSDSVRARTTVAIGMVVVMTLLALGANTPLFGYLYQFVPGFDRFRGISKFIFPTVLFVALLAVSGFDRLIAQRPVSKGALLAVFGIAVAVFLASIIVRRMDWSAVLIAIANTHESYFWESAFRKGELATLLPGLALAARSTAANALAIAGGTCLLVAGLLHLSRRNSVVIWAIPVLALVELVGFASMTRETSSLENPVAQQIQRFVAQHPGSFRIANTINANDAMRIGALDVGGNDPGVVGRYAELMEHLQGGDADHATQYLDIKQDNPLYAILRLGFIFKRNGDGQLQWEALANPLDRMQLIGDYKVVQGRDAVFAALDDNGFDPRRSVVLEAVPVTVPQPDPVGHTRIIQETTDAIDVEVEVDRPAILLITDVYTPSWRVRPLAGSVQNSYQMMPANYALRAVPLQKGKHHFIVEYNRDYLFGGMLISVFSLLLWIVLLGWTRRINPAGGSRVV